jgi:A/G-specific adenine glycosylase
MKPDIKPQRRRDAERKNKISASPRPGGSNLFRDALVTWFGKNARDLPWRRRRDPYAVLVSEMMLQQTQVATVVDYFNRWMERFPDFAALAAAPEADVLHAWQGLGYYSRARNLHRAAQLVLERHGGELPDDLDSIRALPGIGRYTAGAVAAFAFDRATPVVDGNIARVLSRLFDFRNSVDSAAGQKWVWQTSADLQPEKGAGVFNEALMELGALVCLPGRPGCAQCPVRGFCAAEAPEKLPLKKPRRKTEALLENCAWIFKNGRVLLEQQTGARWRGLWKLPAIPEPPAAGSPKDSKLRKPLLKIEYPFTHHRVTLAVFAKLPPKSPGPNQGWFPVDQLDSIAMTAPHRRALKRLLAG